MYMGHAWLFFWDRDLFVETKLQFKQEGAFKLNFTSQFCFLELLQSSQPRLLSWMKFGTDSRPAQLLPSHAHDTNEHWPQKFYLYYLWVFQNKGIVDVDGGTADTYYANIWGAGGWERILKEKEGFKKNHRHTFLFFQKAGWNLAPILRSGSYSGFCGYISYIATYRKVLTNKELVFQQTNPKIVVGAIGSH